MSAGAAPTYLAFDIGGTKVASGFVTLPANANAGADGRPEVTARCEIPTEAARGGVLRFLCRRFSQLMIDVCNNQL